MLLPVQEHLLQEGGAFYYWTSSIKIITLNLSLSTEQIRLTWNPTPHPNRKIFKPLRLNTFKKNELASELSHLPTCSQILHQHHYLTQLALTKFALISESELSWRYFQRSKQALLQYNLIHVQRTRYWFWNCKVPSTKQWLHSYETSIPKLVPVDPADFWSVSTNHPQNATNQELSSTNCCPLLIHLLGLILTKITDVRLLQGVVSLSLGVRDISFAVAFPESRLNPRQTSSNCIKLLCETSCSCVGAPGEGGGGAFYPLH